MWWILGIVLCYIIVCLTISVGLKINRHYAIKANGKYVKEILK